VVSCPVAQRDKEFAMNPSAQNPFDGSSGNYEETLRLIARVSAPEGLEERVQAGLRTVSPKARILRWPEALRLDNPWIQNLARAAAAAAIVAVVVGGGWSVSSRFQSSQPTSAIAVPAHGAGQTGQIGQGGFSSAGAMRTPQTLNGPVVAHPSTTATKPAKPAAKHATKTPVRHGKSVPVKNPVAPTIR
jgi:hypothetical protein